MGKIGGRKGMYSLTTDLMGMCPGPPLTWHWYSASSSSLTGEMVSDQSPASNQPRARALTTGTEAKRYIEAASESHLKLNLRIYQFKNFNVGVKKNI